MHDIVKILKRIEYLMTLDLEDQLWTIDHLAAYFSREKRTISDHILKQSDFPKPVYVPGIAKPYWNSDAVKHWATSPRRNNGTRR